MAAQLSNSAKVVGLVITSHWSPKYDRARIRIETMMKEAGGKSRITIIRAVNELIKAQIFIRVRTGRASILKLGKLAEKSKEQTDSGSIIFDTSKPIIPKTGTRFKEFCPMHESTEDSGERYTKDWELVLGF
ncbi:MAG: hypothetical protein RBR38_10420 [Desulfomicrobium apsheronum]|nr:hypothetical protein [Desulfomicrobium apsheronum]